MTSTFAWLDYSAKDRHAMLEVIDLFREKGTVDELGLGVIRDSFANYLFPGTSTLHSRARYWLFVPWIYQRLESKRTPSSQVDERARRLQAGLVRSLETGGESEGVIGIEARDKVLRPPAVLYWAGLQRHGLNVLAGSIGRYHASLDAFYRSAGRGRSEGDEPELIHVGARNWHAGIPEAPDDFLEQTDFQLTATEAEYLRERFITSSPGSFLAWGLVHRAQLDNVQYPWDHPKLASAPVALRDVVEVGRRFSLLMFGAVLLYNLAMAEKARERGLRDGALADEYRARYHDWTTNRIGPELQALRRWDRSALWSTIERLPVGRISRTKIFAERWISKLLDDPASAADDPAVRTLIADRERVMKGDLARLYNRRALERWSGRSGLYELTYRWNEGRTLFRDIDTGLRSRHDGDG